MNWKNFKSLYLIFCLPLGLLFLSACGHKGEKKDVFPTNFNVIGDAGRVNYMMGRVGPDSLACFILRASLGQVPGTKIDTLGIATNAAYMVLTGDSAALFANAYDSLYNVLPLTDKARILVKAGSDDPQGLGFRLGLEYLGCVRDNNMSVREVKQEIDELRKACGSDTATYRRFIKGFQTALAVDSGRDLKSDIYNTFIDYE